MIIQVPRGENYDADALAKMAALGEQHLSQSIHLKEISQSIINQEELLLIDIGSTWMSLIFNYLEYGKLLDKPLEAKKIVKKSSGYSILNG